MFGHARTDRQRATFLVQRATETRRTKHVARCTFLTLLCLAAVLPLWALQFGRPSADISAGSYTPTPVWQQLDEGSADDDTSVVDSANNPGESDGTGFEVVLGSVPDPQSSSGHVVRVRARRNGGARTITLNWRLYQGATPIIAAKSLQMTDSYQTSSYTLTGGEADAITDYSDLRVRVWGTTSGGGAGSRLRVTWIELETPDAPPSTRNRAIVISRRDTEAQSKAGEQERSPSPSHRLPRSCGD
jgi:hypothetical protein